MRTLRTLTSPPVRGALRLCGFRFPLTSKRSTPGGMPGVLLLLAQPPPLVALQKPPLFFLSREGLRHRVTPAGERGFDLRKEGVTQSPNLASSCVTCVTP